MPASTDCHWFLFTDIEGSTARWEAHPDVMRPVLERHDALLREACAAASGTVFKHTGDGMAAVFDDAGCAVAGSIAAQRALTNDGFHEVDGLPVRMGLHGGDAQFRDGDYFGTTLNRAARVMGVAHGGQVVVTEAGRDAADQRVDATYVDLGLHRLKGLTMPERVYQVCHPDLPSDFPPLLSLNVTLGNLRPLAHGVVGRERETAEISELVQSSPLVTLLGPGGVGKTTLACAAAAGARPSFPDGVWFCDLSGLHDPTLVPDAVAAALGLDRRPGSSMSETLCEALGARHLLLVLDNCEQVAGATADLMRELVAVHSPLRVIATSQIELGVPGEVQLRIAPLGLPGNDTTASAVGACPSVQLLLERAAAAGSSIVLDDTNAAAVARLCDGLDGLPLAIELAAARTKVMSIDDMVDRLDNRLRMLGSSSATDSRRRTMAATLDWSFDLLSEPQQRFFCRLGVFDGDFDLAAVADVTELEEFDALDALDNLVRQSMVTVDHVDGRARYSLLELMRDYANSRLQVASDASAVLDRHARHYARLVETAKPKLWSDEQPEWLDRLAANVKNLRQAFTHLLATDPDAAAQLPLDLWSLWTARNLIDEGIRWCTHAAEVLPADSPRLARVLDDLASLLWTVGENEAGEAACLRSMEVSRTQGTKPAPTATTRLASILAFKGRDDDAYELLVETLDEIRASTEPVDTVEIRCVIGVMLTFCGRAADGAALCEEGLQRVVNKGPGMRCAACDNSSFAYLGVDAERSLELAIEGVSHAKELRSTYSLGNSYQALAYAQRATHDTAGSRRSCAAALRYLRDAGMRNAAVGTLDCLADQLAPLSSDAVVLYAAAAAMRDQIASTGLASQQRAISRRLERLRVGLGDEQFDEAWNTGRGLTLDEAVDYAGTVVENIDALDPDGTATPA